MTTPHSATVPSPLTGDVKYLKSGKMVIITGYVAIPSSGAAVGDTMANNIPGYGLGYGNGVIVAKDNNSTTRYYHITITVNGTLILQEAITGAASLRFCGAYLSA